MRQKLLTVSLLSLVGCGSASTYVHSDAPLGRVVVYRNGIAYFERSARVDGDTLRLTVPSDKVDDFLKSLTVVDAKTGRPPPIAYPTSSAGSGGGGMIQMQIKLPEKGLHDLKLSYVTEAPSWKPSYRVVVGEDGRIRMQGWAIIDNTSGEDWAKVKLGVGSSSALSFRYDLQSIRLVQRETLQSDDLFALAPPVGSATHGGERGKEQVLGDLRDVDIDADGSADASDVVATGNAETKTSKPKDYKKGGKLRASPAPKPTTSMRQLAEERPPADLAGQGAGAGGLQRSDASDLEHVASRVATTKNQVIVEGYADARDGDKRAASLERANRVREALIRRGVAPEQVVAVGNGQAPGRAGGVRIVEAPPAPAAPPPPPAGAGLAASADPIGTSHFESTTPMDVPRGTSAMVPILDTGTKGEIVYLYDAESPRGNATFPFRAVRVENPSESTLESGPVTVFGSGRFIGEGLSEPIPARSVGFVPFALDRQIVVDREDGLRDDIARILTVQRGVFSTEVAHTKKTKLVLHNRLTTAAVVYLRHTVADGFKLTKGPTERSRLGAADLFRVEVPASGQLEVVLEESTPLFKSADIRSSTDLELVKAYISSGALTGPLRGAFEELVKLDTEMANLDQQIKTTREQMNEYRARMDELHIQIVTLGATKTGQSLLRHLETKLGEMNERLSKSTLDLVALEDRLMQARIRFQDGVSELSLDRRTAAN